MSRKGPWEGYGRQAKSRPLSPSRLPLRARERDVWVRARLRRGVLLTRVKSKIQTLSEYSNPDVFQKSLTSVLGYVRFTLYRIELLFTHKNGDFGAISTTKPSCAAPRRSLNRRVTIDSCLCETGLQLIRYSVDMGVLSNSLKADLDDTIFAYDYHSQFGLLSKEKEKLTVR